ncbi:MAG: hypothetical protein RI920_466 [Pseudomonadota bacterium]|jgi:hypothetical protein
MKARQSQGIRYGVQVGSVLSAVALLLLASWHTWVLNDAMGSIQSDTSLMALSLALVVGLRAMSRLDRSLG